MTLDFGTLGLIALVVTSLNSLLLVATRLQGETTRYAGAMRQDALTGLANRRALFDAATGIHADWPRHGSYAVIMLDLDRFREINDRFGHGGGDEALCIVAGFLAATARPQDIVARLGGEEFVIVLPDCTIAEAMVTAESMRRGMHRLTVILAGQAVEVTASLGLAVVGSDDRGFATVLDRADHARHAAKAAGRDRVKLSPGGIRNQRHSRTIRRHGRQGGREQALIPVTVIDGIRHFSSGSHAARRPADARRYY